MAEQLPEWAKDLPPVLIASLRRRGLLLPGGPGLQQVKPGVWAHPAPWGVKEDDGEPGGAS